MIIVGARSGQMRGMGCGCVKVGGRRRSSGMGDLTPEALEGKWQKVYNETRAQFAKRLTYAQAYKVLQPQHVRAQEFVRVAKTMRTLRADQLAQLVAAAAKLERVRNAAKVGYANTPNAAFPNQGEALEAALGPIRWLASVSGQMLKESNARAAFVKAVAKKVINSPGSLFEWAGEQMSKGLQGFGLPRWALPVGLVAAGLLVAAPYVRPLLSARKAA